MGKTGFRGHLRIARKARACSLACGFLLVSSSALALDVAEYPLKAAFIYNFGKFIEWPSSAFEKSDDPFYICLMGNERFGESLQALKKSSYNQRPISVSYPKTLAEARRCHVLYVDDPSNSPLGSGAWKALGEAPVLTVSSDSGAIESGVCIGFVQQSGKLRWALNLDALRRAKLKVSAKLIEVAITVIGEVPP